MDLQSPGANVLCCPSRDGEISIFNLVSSQLTLKVQRTAIKGMPCSLTLDVAPLTGKIIKNRLNIVEREKTLLQNGMLHFVFWISQLSEIDLQSSNLRKRKSHFSEKEKFLKSNRRWS